MARALRWPAVAAWMVASAWGSISAADAPCATRAPTRVQASGASPQASEVRPKAAIPAQEEPAPAGHAAEAPAEDEQHGVRQSVARDDQFEEGGSDFAEIWARHEVVGTANRTKLFHNTRGGPLRLDHTDLWLGPSPGPRMVTYVPADEESRRGLERLLESALADA